MRIVLSILALFATLSTNAAHAQNAAPVPSAEESRAPSGAEGAPRAEIPDEVTVRGRRLADFRDEVRQARERAYDIFNEINSDDDFDVHCKDESRAGTRVPRQVCRAHFENRIAATAAREYMAGLAALCPVGPTGINYQACMFSGAGHKAQMRARAVEVQEPRMHDLMNDEINRLAQQDARFAQAIIDFYEANRRYEDARKGKDD